MYVPFDTLADHARIWIFPISNSISIDQARALESDAKLFVQEWTSHNHALLASAAVMENQFLIISVDESAYGASGCSIDKLMRFIQNMEGEHSISLLFKHKIFIHKGDMLKPMTIQEIKKEIETGDLEYNHYYYDTMIDTKSKLKSEWMKSLDKGWLAKKIMN